LNLNELSEFGCIQSMLLAKRLSSVKFDEIIVSDLRRTEITAEEIIKLTDKENLMIKKTDLIRERNYGLFTGKSAEFFKLNAKVFI
jgi:broad specificity phosphatase PhoE